MKMPQYLFMFLVFPGFLFSSVMGMMAGWLDRKLTARLQWRAGPPWYQNFLDVAKLLFYKETLIPEGVAKGLFLTAPAAALAAATLISTAILAINGNPKSGFVGDIIVLVYLMMMPSIAVMLGGFASRNTLASLGASREMKLMLSYELPFILSLLVPIIKSGYCVKLGDIMLYQQSGNFLIASPSGALAFAVMLICVQAKLGYVPFDMPEAETEIMSGVCIEYSGKALGMLKLAKMVLAFVLPVFFISVYFGGISSDLEGFIKNILQYLGIFALMVVIKNTNPRVRIDHAVRFFWGYVTAAALTAVALAYIGL